MKFRIARAADVIWDYLPMRESRGNRIIFGCWYLRGFVWEKIVIFVVTDRDEYKLHTVSVCVYVNKSFCKQTQRIIYILAAPRLMSIIHV